MAKFLGCKMSWLIKCLDLYAVAQCLGGTLAHCLGGKMSCCQNVWVPKYLVVIISGWQNVLLSKCLGAKISCSHIFWVSKKGGVKMSWCQNFGCQNVGESSVCRAAPGRKKTHCRTEHSPNLPYSEGIGSPAAAIPLLKVM